MENNANDIEKSSVINNYDLNIEAIDALTNDDPEAVPEYSEEELKKYRTKSYFKISDAVKVALIKAWFAGAVCYFFMWGLGTYIADALDMFFILGVAMGMVTDLLLNNVIRFIESTPGENNKWLMVTKRGTVGFMLNIFYGFLILLCVYNLYNLINYTVIGITGKVDTVPLGVEPILFGVFSMAFDFLFVGIKQLVLKLFHRNRPEAE